MAHAQGASAPAPLHVYLSNNMQAFYARRGMWHNGSPQGALQGMLGPVVPFLCNTHRQAFYLTPEQLAALRADLLAIPATAMGRHQRAQFLRRLREAASRADLVLPATDGQPTTAQPTAGAAPIPFAPLQAPAHGKAKALFQDHVMRTMREFVDFTQGSSYTGADHA